MSRVYLSGPITGIEGYKRKFEGWKDQLVACGYDVVNPAELTSVIGESFSYMEIMQIDLDLLQRCDCLAQMPGWELSRGCNIEYGYALGADKIILKVEDLVNGCTEKSRKRPQ